MIRETTFGNWNPGRPGIQLAHMLVPGSLLVVFVLCTIGTVNAARGIRDLEFGHKGRVQTDFSGGFSEARKAVVQSDGRIVVVGTADNKLALARYNDDGSSDSGFGDGGTVTTSAAGVYSGTSVAIQQDSKILAGGEATSDFALARYNPDGSLDSSFGARGIVTTDFFGTRDSIEAILIMPDGRILALGVVGSPGAFGIARYDSSGSLDLSFGVSGKVTFEFLGQGDYARALALQPDGKIVVGGSVTSNHTGIYGLARLNDDGSLDSTFGKGGRVITDFPGVFETLALQPDGKIIAGGQLSPSGPMSGSFVGFGLVRYNPDGSLDPGFGYGGLVTTEFDGNWSSADAVIVQPNGRILATGQSSIPGTLNFSFAIAAYNSDGTLDRGFGVGGKMTDTFFAKQSYITDVTFQPDGKAVAVGHTGKYGKGHSSFAVARYSVATD